MFNYRKANNITGWIVFAISTLVYWLTVEPTASFWDCGEFIACSYKLEVPHPPGAPFYLLLGRMFSLLAGGDTSMVAYWINILSVLAGGFTVLFLFWTITMLGRKLLSATDTEKIDQATGLKLLGAGIVGSLAYSFTDTAWFSAVEAEVYSMSSFFTALVVWAMLKWDLIDDESTGNRWLIFIAYMIGLSIGVHLLNLVTFPALGLIYYFKKYKETTLQGIIVTLLISVVIVLFINDLIIPGLPSLAGSIEIFFVNSLGMPFGSGIIFFVLIFLGGLIFSIYFSQKKAMATLNMFLLGFAFILIGYSSYTIIPIRSAYNPPIDENNPENIISFVSYLKREQYGSRPLLFGPYYDAKLTGTEKGAKVYERRGDRYEVVDRKLTYKYDESRQTIFPRIYSSNPPSHIEAYQNALGLAPGEQPNFADNLSFFFSDQIGRMYMRYFLWNFSGRESDEKGAGWTSPVDAFKELPDSIKNNAGHNNYLMIPLIIGLIGFFFNLNKNPKVFGAVGLLFVMLGVALVVYLNMPPVEPRERDYIFVGSFYAFCIWIGFGVLSISRWLSQVGPKGATAAVMATVIGLSAPTMLLAENWNDHDRSDRYFSVDTAKNFLDSCAPNAIIFTGGDNDTFPLWYVQEVEGYRTDVRVIVLSYFNTDWYVHQMMRSQYDSEALPFSFTADDVRQGGVLDYAYYQKNDRINGAIDAKRYLQLLKKKSPALIAQTQDGQLATVPSKSMYYDIDSAKVDALGIVPENLKHLMVDKMVWTMKTNVLEKNALMVIDLITNNNWERPIYFNHTSKSGIGIDLNPYLVQEGNAFRLLPVKNPNPRADFVSTEVMYKNFMGGKFHHTGLQDSTVYYNKDYRDFVTNSRANFNTLAEALIYENQEEKAKEVLNRSLEWMPTNVIPADYTASQTIAMLLLLNEADKALPLIHQVTKNSDQMLTYYAKQGTAINRDIQVNLYLLNNMADDLKRAGQADLEKEVRGILNKHLAAFGGRR
ncbi:membrane protein [Fulvitalea axinellae]|uniref:Membrane protein n=1 Tax=Fulvitalea axinellae TaxID=1182444 RepID=A0AAU9CQW8_9BACT|nr:membrane protein [Fulvitalea axinellae]